MTRETVATETPAALATVRMSNRFFTFFVAIDCLRVATLIFAQVRMIAA
jgi:hypothetical protein